MRAASIARNYAEALFALGEKSGRSAQYADLLDALAAGIAGSPKVQAVLASPKVTKPAKVRLLTAALASAPVIAPPAHCAKRTSGLNPWCLAAVTMDET